MIPRWLLSALWCLLVLAVQLYAPRPQTQPGGPATFASNAAESEELQDVGGKTAGDDVDGDASVHVSTLPMRLDGAARSVFGTDCALKPGRSNVDAPFRPPRS